jgi:hypothetical protein
MTNDKCEMRNEAVPSAYCLEPVSVRPETIQCHSERSEESLLPPLNMRFFVALLLRMTSENRVPGWTLVSPFALWRHAEWMDKLL